MGVTRYNTNFDTYMEVVSKCRKEENQEVKARLSLIAESLKKLLSDEESSYGTHSTPSGNYERDRAHVNTNDTIKHT